MSSNGYFRRVHAQTPTRMWINNVSREQARLAIEAGAVGCTQNPAYVWKMLQDERESPYVYEKLDAILTRESDDNKALLLLQRELIEGVAGVFMDMYEKSRGRYGYVSIQGDPFDETSDTIIEQGISNTKNLPNLTAKIPVVEGGIEAIRHLAPLRIPINTTEIMTVSQTNAVIDLYEEVCAKIPDPAHMYYSVISGIYDEYIAGYAGKNGIDVSRDALWHAGMAIAKKCYELVHRRASGIRFIGGGARGLHHFTEMVGADAVVTINWNGTADKLIEQDPPVTDRFSAPIPAMVIDELTEKLEDFRRAYYLKGMRVDEYEDFGAVALFREQFEAAWRNALDAVSERRRALSEGKVSQAGRA